MKRKFIIFAVVALIIGLLGFTIPVGAKTLDNPPTGADLRIYRIIDAISGEIYQFNYSTGSYETYVGGGSEVDPVFTESVAYDISSEDITNWNGKLSSFTELDPVFGNSVAYGISSGDITSWNNKLSSYTETDPVVKALSGIIVSNGTTISAITNNSSNWTTAYNWGNHADAGYIKNNQNITLSGDLSGNGTTSISGTVTGIKGATLPALSTGYLYYNGSSWVFQTPSSSGLDPVATVTLWDDFASGLLTTGNIGCLGWGFTGTAPTVIASVVNHNGIRQIPTTTTSGAISAIWLGGAVNTDTVLYSDYCDMTFIVRMTDVTSDTAFVGAMDAMGTAVGNQDRYGFEYIDSSDTYWMMVTGNGSSSTRTATDITVAINTWYKLRIVRDGSGVNYYIDGVSKGSVTNTLPDTALNIGFHIQTNTTVAKYLQADLFNLTLGVTR